MTSTLNTRPPFWNRRVIEFVRREIQTLTHRATANRKCQWRRRVILGVVCAICATASAEPIERAEPTRPVGWRGDGSGRYPLAAPVTSWSADRNILWKTEVGKGNSTPVVIGSRVLLTSEPDVLICIDAKSGRELWRRVHRLEDISPEAASKGGRHVSQYGDATPTVVTDGKWIWTFFGTGIVSCHDLTGECRWKNWYDVRRTTVNGRTSSPVLVGDRLLVHFGSMVCLDSATGKLVWENHEARAAYGTPAAVRIGDVDLVVTPKGHVVRVADGKMLASDLGACTYTSPVVQGRNVYFLDGTMTAVQLPETMEAPFECKELWARELEGEFFASPLINGGRINLVDKAAKLYVIDASTGKTILSRVLELPAAEPDSKSSVYSSPCLAGQRLFISDESGQTVVLEATNKDTAIIKNALPAGSGGTSTFSGNRMFTRGGEFLYCLTPPPKN
jgi:outer membrane protein assembly factor BamB